MNLGIFKETNYLNRPIFNLAQRPFQIHFDTKQAEPSWAKTLELSWILLINSWFFWQLGWEKIIVNWQLKKFFWQLGWECLFMKNFCLKFHSWTSLRSVYKSYFFRQIWRLIGSCWQLMKPAWAKLSSTQMGWVFLTSSPKNGLTE